VIVRVYTTHAQLEVKAQVICLHIKTFMLLVHSFGTVGVAVVPSQRVAKVCMVLHQTVHTFRTVLAVLVVLVDHGKVQAQPPQAELCMSKGQANGIQPVVDSIPFGVPERLVVQWEVSLAPPIVQLVDIPFTVHSIIS
jgi:hypothetical protein